ncbi:hypothetical protein D3C79_909190 [compost metagenome]
MADQLNLRKLLGYFHSEQLGGANAACADQYSSDLPWKRLKTLQRSAEMHDNIADFLVRHLD